MGLALYRPFVELALQFDLPIVAANLSRSDATRIVRQGADAVFNETERRELALEGFNAILPRHEYIVQVGHCNLLPTSALPGLARAQIARDAVLARSLRPYLDRGVILLTGNGHARRDIGVPRHFTAAEQERIWSIGLLEEGTPAERAANYDVAFLTPEQDAPRSLRGVEAEARLIFCSESPAGVTLAVHRAARGRSIGLSQRPSARRSVAQETPQ